MKITILLQRQHDVFRGILGEMRNALKDVEGNGPARLERALRQLLPLLAAHEAIEHDLIFPALEAAAEKVAPEILESFEKDHEEVNKRAGNLMEALQTPDGILSQLVATTDFTSVLMEHLEQEEALFFPLIEKFLTEEMQRQLAREGSALGERK